MAFWYIVLTVVSYLLGSVPTAYLVARHITGEDIRNYGSGNVGSTNAVRMLGFRSGALIFLVDLLKGLLPALVGYLVAGPVLGMVCGGVALLAHIFPIWLQFRGGKGIATILGVALILCPLFAVVALAIWGLTLLLVNRVAVASCVAATTLPAMLGAAGQHPAYTVGFALLVVVILFKHRVNFVQIP